MRWKDQKFEPSPTRNYVAMCHNEGYTGHYFRKFILPQEYDNTCSRASYYFTERLCAGANVECSIPLEQYQDCKDQDEINQRNRVEMERFFPKKTVKVKVNSQ